MMPATSSTYVQHALWNYPSHALREQKTKLLTARGPESTVCTASLRKSAEPAYWPRRRPALGQRCTAESGLQGNAETLHDAEDFATCAINIRDLMRILHIPTKGRNYGRVPDIRPHILAIDGAGRDTRENRNQTIKCRTKNQTIKIPRIPLSHPTRFRNQNNQNPGKIPGKRKHCARLK